jgi:hypothetical protein
VTNFEIEIDEEVDGEIVGVVVTWPDAEAVAVDYWGYYVANDRFNADRPIRLRGTTKEDAAHTLVDKLCADADPKALGLVVALASSAPDRESLFYLGAGPVEDLVRTHGDALVGDVLAAAAQHPRFKIALSGVWLEVPPKLQAQTLAKLMPWLGDDDTTPFI